MGFAGFRRPRRLNQVARADPVPLWSHRPCDRWRAKQSRYRPRRSHRSRPVRTRAVPRQYFQAIPTFRHRRTDRNSPARRVRWRGCIGRADHLQPGHDIGDECGRGRARQALIGIVGIAGKAGKLVRGVRAPIDVESEMGKYVAVKMPARALFNDGITKYDGPNCVTRSRTPRSSVISSLWTGITAAIGNQSPARISADRTGRPPVRM